MMPMPTPRCYRGAAMALLSLLSSLGGRGSVVVAQGPCNVCPLGETIPEVYSNVTVESFNETCEIVAQYAQFATDGDETCDFYQMTGVAECGCDRGPVDENACSLCPDGSDVLETNKDDFSEMWNMTCGQLEEFIFLVISADSEDQCPSAQLAGVMDCGCSAPDTGCSLCAGGSPVPDAFADASLLDFGFDTTCGDFEKGLNVFEDDSEMCSTYQLYGTVMCGCPFVPPENPTCPICLDGSSSPNPVQVLYEDDEFGEITCGLFEMQFAFYPPDEPGFRQECDAFQATAGAACGCANPPAPACDVCPPGQDLNFTKLIVVPDREAPGGNGGSELVPCGEVVFDLSLNSTTCEEEKDLVAKTCCSAGAGDLVDETTTITTTPTTPSTGTPPAETTTPITPAETSTATPTTPSTGAPPAGTTTPTTPAGTTATTEDPDADVGTFSGAAAIGSHLLFTVVIAVSISTTF